MVILNMRLKQKSGIFRVLVKFTAALLAAFLIEMLFNIPALTAGYSPVSILENSEIADGQLICRKSFEEPLYVGKLEIKGTFDADIRYTVNLTVINDFGVEEEAVLADFVYSVFDCAYTNIQERVSGIEIVFADADGISLDEITVLNEFRFNGYRVLFFALVIWFAALILSGRSLILDKTEWFYAVFALCFGMFVIVLSGPRAVGWDEEVHYSSVYATNLQTETVWSAAAEANTTRLTPDPNTAEELRMLKDYMNEAGEETTYTETARKGIRQEWVRYAPMILLHQIGMWLDLPYTMVFYMGRFGNLLFCVFLTWLAIRQAGDWKLLIAVLAMLPTVLFQCSMYTYDGIIFVCVNLGFVLWMKEAGKTNQEPEPGKLIWIMLLFAVGCIAKPVYLPLYLLLLPLFHRLSQGSEKRKRTFVFVVALAAVLAVTCAVAVGIYLTPVITQILEGELADVGDSRGGDTGVVQQLISVLVHPLAFLKMLVHDIVSLDTFWIWEGTSSTLASNAMFLSFYILGCLKDEWSYFLVPFLAFLFLVSPTGRGSLEKKTDVSMPPKWPGRKEEMPGAAAREMGNPASLRVLNGVAVILCILLTWVAMYLVFTPIGSGSVSGVQPRYFLPLLLPLAYALKNTRFYVRMSKLRYYQIALGGALLLTGLCVYQCLIQGRTL